MNSAKDTFKETKRNLKQNMAGLEDELEAVEMLEDNSAMIKRMSKVKQLKVKSDRLYAEMEAQWKMLNPSEKAQYKTKITKFNTRLQEDR